LQLDTWGTEFHEKIDFHPNDLVLTKNRVSAFYCTPLEAFLRANKIQNIIFCGVSTDMAVQTTAREAHDRDYKVIIVKDACGSMSAEMHDGALQGLQRIALITSTHDLTTEQLA
jgi:ureidoacrylate peracid hydrolase